MAEQSGTIELTEKQLAFCREYLIDLNATQAAIRAGYSRKTAYAIGSENLKKPEIRAYIDNEIAERAKATRISAEYIVERLKEVAEKSLQERPVMRYDPVEKSMVHAKDVIMEEDGTMTEVGIFEFDSQGANKSLELLGKHLGMFTDKSEVKTQSVISGKVVIVKTNSTGVPFHKKETDVDTGNS